MPGILADLPPPPLGKKGWPWTVETPLSEGLAHLSLPMVSIVTPSFQQGAFIEATIRSILLQNYPKLEYFIIDGGSTDQTLKVIEKYAFWIDFWISERDAGQAAAINKGLTSASGIVLNWVNSDDLLMPGTLFRIAQAFEQYPDAGIIHGKAEMIDAAEKLLRYKPPHPANWTKEQFHLLYLAAFPYTQPAAFFRKECLDTVGYLDPSFQFTMDVDLFARIALNYPILHLQEEVLARFRIHEGSKTNQLNDIRQRETARVMRRLAETFGPPEHPLLVKGLQYLETFGLISPSQDEPPAYSIFVSEQYRLEHWVKAIFLHLFLSAEQDYNQLNFKTARAKIKAVREHCPDLLPSFDRYKTRFKIRWGNRFIVRTMRWLLRSPNRKTPFKIKNGVRP